MIEKVKIRECETIDELAACVNLQRAVFALPEIEISPVRHFIVTKNAGGFTLGAFKGDRLIGFVLSMPAFLRGERAFYSHMTAVHADFQSYGIGARLKWAQRDYSLAQKVKFIKWTFEPVKARNAYFNLEKLGAIVSEYRQNFYGIDYATAPQLAQKKIGLASDRLFAEWHLDSDKVKALADGKKFIEPHKPAARIETLNDWRGLVDHDPKSAVAEQLRIRSEFETAFEAGLVVRGFDRDGAKPSFLLYKA